MDTWTDKNFEQLSWHDCHVYGFSIRQGNDGRGQLIIDLDYIVEWRQPTPGTFRFLVAPATLIFQEARKLRWSVDYANCGLGPFSIHNIEREVKTYPNASTSFTWRILTHLPNSDISFTADGFSLKLRAAPVEIDGQHLTTEERFPN